MAAKKPPAKSTARRTPAKPVAARKAAEAKKLGFDSVAAMQSVTRQYGLVGGGPNQFKRPDAAFLERQMVANGWGMGQTADTPVNIGGARWMTGPSGLIFTGQRSDAAKRNPGAAYNATSGQVAYGKTFNSKAKGGGKGGGKGKGKGKGKGGGAQGSAVTTDGGGLAGEASMAAEAAAAFVPYAEADTVNQSYLGAQGKAYKSRHRGQGVLGQDKSRPEDTSTVTDTAAGSESSGGRSTRGKHPGKKATTKAKSKKSAGGKKVTTRERKTIQRTKARARK